MLGKQYYCLLLSSAITCESVTHPPEACILVVNLTPSDMWRRLGSLSQTSHISEAWQIKATARVTGTLRSKPPVAFAWSSRSDMARPQCQPGLVRGRDGGRGGRRGGSDCCWVLYLRRRSRSKTYQACYWSTHLELTSLFGIPHMVRLSRPRHGRVPGLTKTRGHINLKMLMVRSCVSHTYQCHRGYCTVS